MCHWPSISHSLSFFFCHKNIDNILPVFSLNFTYCIYTGRLSGIQNVALPPELLYSILVQICHCFSLTQGLKPQKLTAHSFGGSNPKSGCLQGWVLGRTLLWVADSLYHLLIVPHMTQRGEAPAHSSCSEGSILMAQLLPRGSPFKYHHIGLRIWT